MSSQVEAELLEQEMRSAGSQTANFEPLYPMKPAFRRNTTLRQQNQRSGEVYDGVSIVGADRVEGVEILDTTDGIYGADEEICNFHEWNNLINGKLKQQSSTIETSAHFDVPPRLDQKLTTNHFAIAQRAHNISIFSDVANLDNRSVSMMAKMPNKQQYNRDLNSIGSMLCATNENFVARDSQGEKVSAD